MLVNLGVVEAVLTPAGGLMVAMHINVGSDVKPAVV